MTHLTIYSRPRDLSTYDPLLLVNDCWMYTECERGGRNLATVEVQRAAVHKGHVRPRTHSRDDRRSDADARRQRDAAAGHTVVTLHRTFPQLRPELGEGSVSYQRSPRSTNCFCHMSAQQR